MARHSDITVVIPCFNHGRFLLDSVDRALGQDGGPPKVIVVDDGSTDEATLRALDEVPREVEVIRQANAGVAAARNAGFENSDSELLLMVDADDRLTTDALDVLRPPLEANPDVGYCYGLMRLIGTWSGSCASPTSTPTSCCTARSPGRSSVSSAAGAGRTPAASTPRSTAMRTGTSA
ncbi:MAG TPA: glycosyltransferase family A protein [Solirubrobacterales bacterium]|nr:glycosyltransferase family A protein [Solirubrobacterales bacterium]